MLLYMRFGKKTDKDAERKSREDRFKEVAERRVQEILYKMRLLKNCSNKANYSYTDEQVKKIISAVEDEWKLVKHEFNKHNSKAKEFKL